MHRSLRRAPTSPRPRQLPAQPTPGAADLQLSLHRLHGGLTSDLLGDPESRMTGLPRSSIPELPVDPKSYGVPLYPGPRAGRVRLLSALFGLDRVHRPHVLPAHPDRIRQCSTAHPVSALANTFPIRHLEWRSSASQREHATSLRRLDEHDLLPGDTARSRVCLHSMLKARVSGRTSSVLPQPPVLAPEGRQTSPAIVRCGPAVGSRSTLRCYVIDNHATRRDFPRIRRDAGRPLVRLAR